MAFAKTTKKKRNAAANTAAPETALPVAGSQARAKQPGKSAAVVESTGISASFKVARTAQMTSVAATSNNPAVNQSIITPVKTMAATAGAHSVEAAPPATSAATESLPLAQTSFMQPSTEEISRRAYFYWAERGFQHGFADEDWTRAEADLTR